ncbi:MAG: lamin tail domain-containing protein [Akkermansiaceae bacterium]
MLTPHNAVQLIPALLLFLGGNTAMGQRADSVVTINEIHYHPAFAGEPEWVELHNQMAVRVDVSGWKFTEGIDFTFPEGAIMEPGSYWVLSSNPSHASLSGLAHVFGPFSGQLNNGGETLRLRNRHGRIMDELDFGDRGKWPEAADGGGVSLCKIDPERASGPAGNWTWSKQAGGTPGATNFDSIGGETQTEAVNKTSPWRIDTSGSALAPSWRDLEFDDSGWQPGSGTFATALIQNASFEAETFSVSPGYVSGNGAITAWGTLENGLPGGDTRIGINTPGSLDPFANNGMGPAGNNVAFIRGGLRSLAQDINGLTPGERYLLSYRENGRSPTTPVGSATLGGIEVVPQHNVAAVDSLDVFTQPYHVQVGGVFTATASTAQLNLSNHAGIGDSILYDDVHLNPVALHYSGAGSATIHRAFADNGDPLLILLAEVDPGTGGDGVSFGFKTRNGTQSLVSHGALWLQIDDSGEAVLRADEEGGNHIVALSTAVPVTTGSSNRIALIWDRTAGKASVVVNQATIFNEINLGLTAGGSDGIFDPNIAGVSATFTSTAGNLSELAVARGPAPETTLPIPAGPSVYRFRNEFEFTGSAASADLLLSLAQSGEVTVYLNGVLLHEEPNSGSSDVLLRGDALVAGTNVFAIELATPVGAENLQLALATSLTTIENDSGDGPERSPLRLSEISAAGAGDFFVEIANTASLPLELSGFSLNSFSLPMETLNPGELRAFPVSELGFAPLDGDVLFLRSSQGEVADAQRVKNRLRAYEPDSETWQHPDIPTPGAANSFALDSRVVINEIHYHQRPVYPDPINNIDYEEPALEWIELFNRSGEMIDLSAWSLRDAVDYDFPEGTMLPPSGYIVISNSEFSGSLNNRRDRIHLRDAAGNTADVVEYLDDRPWPRNADGKGSSLELRHPNADNNNPAAWEASDESPKSVWQNFSYRGRGVEPPGNNNPNHFHEFLMGMLAAGEVLIDDISVLEDPDGAAIELIQNGNFESVTPGAIPDKWRIFGNHRESEIVNLPEGGRALKLVSTGRLEHSYNLASTTFANGRTLNSSRTYEISFRAKWLSGSPQLNTRLYFNRLSRTHILPQPTTTGTPGADNTTLTAAVPPMVSSFRHAPLVPSANSPIRVHATMAAPDGIDSATAHYNVNEDGWLSVPMSGNAVGEYVAILPGQASGSVVQFYVEALANSGASAMFPPEGENSRALFRVDDRSVGNREVQVLRMMMLASETNFMHTSYHTPSNQRMGTTLIYNDREVWYDAGVRLRGSSYGRRGSRVGWNIKFPADRPFRGVHETVAIDGGFSVPRGNGSGFLQVGPGVATNELIYNQMANRAGGVPASHDDVIYVEAPRAGDDKMAQLKMARFGDIWKSSSFDRGDEGTSFKFELIYHPRTTIDGNPESPKSVYNAVRGVDIRDMGPDKEAYRHNFWIQNQSDRDDYDPLIDSAMAISESGANLRDATDATLDIDNWLRVMAFQSLTMTVDSYNNGLAHNMLIYERPRDGRTMWIPWDVDHAFYASPNSSIFGQANGDFADVVQIPANRRAYCGHLRDLCHTGFDPAYIAGWVTHFNDVGKMPIAAHYTQWITNRRNYVLGQLNSQHPAQTFRITTNSGNNFSIADSSVILRGKGWIDVKEIRLTSSGETLDVYWIDNNDWEVVVPLLVGANAITLNAFDIGGAAVGSDRITVTNTGSLEPAGETNLVVSEIMFHPADPTVAEITAGFIDGDLFEYLELENIGPVTVDLSGAIFTNGINFDFSTGSISQLAPGGRVLIVRNQVAFESRHGVGLPVTGEFQNETGLANGGERLRLAGINGISIRDFSYDDKHPWPEDADGNGHSLVLIDPGSNPDHGEAGNWRLSSLPGGNAGGSDAHLFEGDPMSDDDGDGLSNFMNHALGGSGAAFAPVFSVENGVITLSHTRNLAADDVDFETEFSIDLVTWMSAGSVPVSETAIGDGNSLVTWKIDLGIEGRGFVRLRVMQR